MKIFVDTEFIERGPNYPLTLISIGAVRDDGEEFYAVSSDFDEAVCNEWVKTNVLPALGSAPRKPVVRIADEFRLFAGQSPEFWADYCAYDWVVICQMYGTMMDLPSGWPMWCHDLRNLAGERQFESKGVVHNAFDDAITVRCGYATCTSL